MKYDGRKIGREIENPIDNLIIDLWTGINRRLSPKWVSPNLLTTFSLVTGVLSAWFIYKDLFLHSGIFYFLSYLFDCLDGNFARMYNQVTKFGDFYDHFTDRVKMVLVIIAILTNKVISYRAKVIFMVVFFIFFAFLVYHMSCQEMNVKSGKSMFLSMYRGICSCKNYINITRFFGYGTFNLVILGFIMYFYVAYKKLNLK